MRNEANLTQVESNVVSMLDIVPIVMVIGPIVALVAKLQRWFGKKEIIPGRIKRGNTIEFRF